MAEVTLGDYTGFIFREVVRAREISDAHSRLLAEFYARDEVLRHFSVPRFRVNRIEVSIPVVVSSVRYSQYIRFAMAQEQFVAFIWSQVEQVIVDVRSSAGMPSSDPWPVRDDIAVALTDDFWRLLASNQEAGSPTRIVQQVWPQIFERALISNGLIEQYIERDPGREILSRSMDRIARRVINETVVDQTAITGLLVDPETHAVEWVNSDGRALTIKAELKEEGFYIREVAEAAGGAVHTVVEFE